VDRLVAIPPVARIPHLQVYGFEAIALSILLSLVAAVERTFQIEVLFYSTLY
jgi:hypothetical protein